MTLKMIEPGTRVIVQRLIGHGKVKRRLMDMGIIPGTEMEVQKVAPLGDPVEVKFKGYNLSLRHEEADKILVEILPSKNADIHTCPRKRSRFGRHRFRFGRFRNACF
jgi:ferrous iron transport protein A